MQYFARSFIFSKRAEVKPQILDLFEKCNQDEERTTELYIDFVWSVCYCLVDGFAQMSLDECISLQESCLMDSIDIKIKMIEPGECFKEFITCDRNENLKVDAKDMKPMRCIYCWIIEGGFF